MWLPQTPMAWLYLVDTYSLEKQARNSHSIQLNSTWGNLAGRKSGCHRCSFFASKVRGWRDPIFRVKAPVMIMKTGMENFSNTKNIVTYATQGTEKDIFDVVIIGCGPAGLALAAALSELGLRITVIDPRLDRPWSNNYGVWLDELEKLNLADCLDPIWPETRVYIDEDRTKLLPYAYGRVDKTKMKSKLMHKCLANGVVFLQMTAKNVTQEEGKFCRVHLSQGDEIYCRLVVDATGHYLSFVKFDVPHEPGFQAAYGIEVEVESHCFPVDEMLLMDFRDSHMRFCEQDMRDSSQVPTFLYAMPCSTTRIFLEETSLIRRPAVSFEHLKERLLKRLEFLQIKVKNVIDEEYCLIPMGGALPQLDQEVLGFGGSAGMVHPATGYMFSRTMNLASCVAHTIKKFIHSETSSTRIAKSVWNELWSGERLLQRSFFQFGGEYLSDICLREMRDFFWAFFMLPDDEWKAFLSFGLEDSRERLIFGLHVFSKTSTWVQLSLMKEAMIRGRIKLLKSVIL
eukprot:jgi/Galph1/4421/GphlegSOOS_G3042.1